MCEIFFFLCNRFPSDPAMKDLWAKSLGWRTEEVSPKDLICTAHFEEKFIDRSSLCNIRLKRNAVPTLYERHLGFRKKVCVNIFFWNFLTDIINLI